MFHAVERGELATIPMQGFEDRGVTADDIAGYKTHNVTADRTFKGGGVVRQQPVSHGDQCGCEGCRRVIRKMPASAADVGKNASL